MEAVVPKNRIVIDGDEYEVDEVVGSLLLALSLERDYYKRRLIEHHIEVDKC